MCGSFVSFIFIGIINDYNNNNGFDSVLNLEFSFSQVDWLTNAKEPTLPDYLSIHDEGEQRWFELESPIPFPTTITVTKHVWIYLNLPRVACKTSSVFLEE